MPRVYCRPVTARGPVLETPRLRLRPFTREDQPDHTQLYGDPEVTRYLGGGPFEGAEIQTRSRRAIDLFVGHWVSHGFGVWAVLDRATGRFIGQCGLSRLPDLGEVEVLYALERGAWGRGLASEAARAAVRHGFEVVGLERIIALVRPANAGSRRVLGTLGMTLDGVLELQGQPALRYVLTRAAWAVASGASFCHDRSTGAHEDPHP